MKTLKETVLEKAKELMPDLGTMFIYGGWDIGRSSKDKYELHRTVNGSRISYQFDPKVSETDPVWPLAAQVLGIGVEIEDWSKPIDGVLHIPDELDSLMNYAGHQHQFCHISKAFSWQEMLARIIIKCQAHFTNSKIKRA